MIRLLTAVGFAAITLAASVSAAPITYRFTVTATDGVLTGATATGAFTYDSSVVAPNSTVIAVDLLTHLDFTWNGVAYNATTANTGDLVFDSVGARGRPGAGLVRLRRLQARPAYGRALRFCQGRSGGRPGPSRPFWQAA